jgi:hypothetical protein
MTLVLAVGAGGKDVFQLYPSPLTHTLLLLSTPLTNRYKLRVVNGKARPGQLSHKESKSFQQESHCFHSKKKKEKPVPAVSITMHSPTPCCH